MKATAKHPVNYNGEWYEAGETFDIDPKDAHMMQKYCEVEMPKAEPTAFKAEANENAVRSVSANRKNGRKRN